MTRKEWDAEWWTAYADFAPGRDPEAFSKAHRYMVKRFGPRPPAEPKPSEPEPFERPGVVGVVKLGLKARKVFKMGLKFDFSVIATAVSLGLSSAGAAWTLANADAAISTGEWVTIAWAFLSAALAGLLHKPDQPQA